MQVTMRQHCDEFERYSAGCADQCVGTYVPVKLGEQVVGSGECVAVGYAEDGTYLELTVEMDLPEHIAQTLRGPLDVSFGAQ